MLRFQWVTLQVAHALNARPAPDPPCDLTSALAGSSILGNTNSSNHHNSILEAASCCQPLCGSHNSNWSTLRTSGRAPLLQCADPLIRVALVKQMPPKRRGRVARFCALTQICAKDGGQTLPKHIHRIDLSCCRALTTRTADLSPMGCFSETHGLA